MQNRTVYKRRLEGETEAKRIHASFSPCDVINNRTRRCYFQRNWSTERIDPAETSDAGSDPFYREIKVLSFSSEARHPCKRPTLILVAPRTYGSSSTMPPVNSKSSSRSLTFFDSLTIWPRHIAKVLRTSQSASREIVIVLPNCGSGLGWSVSNAKNLLPRFPLANKLNPKLPEVFKYSATLE